MQDILGLSSSGGGGGMFGGGGGGMGRMVRNAVNTFGSMLNRFGESSGFMVGNQDGNTKTYSTGLGYIDNWNNKVQLNSNYFFNVARNSNDQFLTREYYAGKSASQMYDEQSNSLSTNSNHRLNFRLEYTIDSLNSLIFTPKINTQNNESNSNTYANTISQAGLLNKVENHNDRETKGYNASAELLIRHKFELPGRTVSANFSFNGNRKTINANRISQTIFYSGATIIDNNDQFTDQLNRGNGYSGNINYTEPLHQDGILQMHFSQSFNRDRSDKDVSDFDTLTGAYNLKDTMLSNLYSNVYKTTKAGAAYRIKHEGLNASAELNYQRSRLEGEQTFPKMLGVYKSFAQFLPTVRIMYRFSKTNFFRFQYNTNINAPSVSQLQNTIDNSNTLQLKAGNPDLEEEMTHRLNLTYLSTEIESGSNFFVMLNYSLTKNYVGNEIYTATTAFYHPRGVWLQPGAQLTFPVNLNRSSSARTFINYSFPVSFIMSNLSVFTSVNYSVTPARINTILNESKTVSIMPGMNISSNISEDIDFKITYMPTWYRTRNDAVILADNEYIIHNASVGGNWVFWGETFIKSDFAYNYNSGLGDGIDKKFYTWNAGIGTKFLSDNSLEARLDVFDLLNQNKSLNRNVTETYIENKTSEVLKRYYLFTLTYNLKMFEAK
ncbi:MAG: outer membrane beta-barrel protein [Ignavibacteriales bacterium]|nr:outer membrane beta-barrel protein [Ignavibacteriales bacterium]